MQVLGCCSFYIQNNDPNEFKLHFLSKYKHNNNDQDKFPGHLLIC